MAKPTEQSGESFMLKLARFIVDKRNLVFLVVIIGLIFSVFSCRSKASASGRLATITLAVPKVVNCSSMTSSAGRVSESAGR